MTPQNHSGAPADRRAGSDTTQTPANPQKQARAARRGRWTLGEVAKLRQHYPTGGARAVQAAGVNRARTAITQKASDLNVTTYQRRSLLGDAEPQAGSTLLRLPAYPKAVADALHALAESRPTPAEYERRKAEILRTT